jgi:hypothetical protein
LITETAVEFRSHFLLEPDFLSRVFGPNKALNDD